MVVHMFVCRGVQFALGSSKLTSALVHLHGRGAVVDQLSMFRARCDGLGGSIANDNGNLREQNHANFTVLAREQMEALQLISWCWEQLEGRGAPLLSVEAEIGAARQEAVPEADVWVKGAGQQMIPIAERGHHSFILHQR